MPLRLPDRLPAIDILKNENIFVMDNSRATTQDIRPLRIVILNLMPLKITTETDLIRLLSNTPLQLEISFMKLRSHTSKNTPIEHMMMFYRDFESMRNEKFDGMIITGAPVETLDFEEVNYWDEITDIFNWARTHVTSTLYICWAAQAGLYYHYGIPKYPLEKKMFGIFPQYPLEKGLPIFRGFDDVFMMPHSRHTEIHREDILANKDLTLIAESPDCGVSIVMARAGREFYITGHLEYAPNTLDTEYRRDKGIRDDVDLPKNYYLDNNPDNPPLVTWRAHANLLYANWINYYVYQETGIAAIDHGADAVYIGAPRFGARAAAGNSIDDICQLCSYAHQFGAKVYVTLNTIVYDDEIESVRTVIVQLEKAGVDAILVQDMAVLTMLQEQQGPMALHASTQTDNRTAEKVRWLQDIGFSRAVLARELSAEEIAKIHREVPGIELEVQGDRTRALSVVVEGYEPERQPAEVGGGRCHLL